jgi:HTH-type transcriptional repressor of NAD biosynthesis genes
MKPYRKGLVLGKFMPMHKGHEYLIRFAQGFCEELTVVVDCLKDQTYSTSQRKKWIEEEIPGVKVVALQKEMPQDPSETADFWSIWKEAIFEAAGKPDVVVAAMDYGWTLAHHLGCEMVACDVSRKSLPISATQIREDTNSQWDWLCGSAKASLTKRLIFLGPESTGKTTLAQKMAQEEKTIYVPEYAKALIDRQHGEFFEHNVKSVLKAQRQSENVLAREDGPHIFCDSDALSTLIWSQTLFGHAPEEAFQLSKRTGENTMTFLMTPETKWVEDSHRKVVGDKAKELDFRWKMFHEFEELLLNFKRPYLVVPGNFEEKEDFVRNWVQNDLKKPKQSHKIK